MMETQEKDDTNIFKDRVLRCVDCGCSYTFRSGEQAYFHSKGLSEPKRCKACRELRRTTIVPGREVNHEQ
ncbi:MAG: zinc-ribbon domain containing protein [Dehalococcoidia bacterium]